MGNLLLTLRFPLRRTLCLLIQREHIVVAGIHDFTVKNITGVALVFRLGIVHVQFAVDNAYSTAVNKTQTLMTLRTDKTVFVLLKLF